MIVFSARVTNWLSTLARPAAAALSVGLGLVLLGAAPPASRAADDGSAESAAEEAAFAAAPRNLDGALRSLVAWHRTGGRAALSADALRAALGRRAGAPRSTPRLAADNRVVVVVTLDGTRAADQVKEGLRGLGSQIDAAVPIAARHGVWTEQVSALVPLANLEAAAGLPGVFSVVSSPRPRRHVGSVTSEGVAALRADLVNGRGFTGRGITVGVVSDSYDQTGTAPTAAADVASGDLPGAGNPLGHTQPVIVLVDAKASDQGTDEGRAMLQIVHDVAPDATLAFATGNPTSVSFANNIRALRTDPRANCDVIVDDLTYPDEPFFSDGVVAQAVDDVVNRTDLAGKPVIYYSAAGNEGGAGYEAIFSPVSNAAVRTGAVSAGNLKLDQVPNRLTAGGFHNFRGAEGDAGVKVAQSITVLGNKGANSPQDVSEFDLQWDDPFGPGQVTTDYNLLVFDKDGNYVNNQPKINSAPTDNIATGQALESVFLPRGSYQFVIARSKKGAQQATRLRYTIFDSANTFTYGKFLRTNVVTISPHAGAVNADGVAAYDQVMTPVASPNHQLGAPEPFSALGPQTVYFDRTGARLATPAVRSSPTLAGPDDVSTTLSGFTPFFGTSAAAPHLAAVASLLLQAGGGPGSLSALQMRGLLQSTAVTPHDLDPYQSTALLGAAGSATNATVSALGDESYTSAIDNRFFTVANGAGSSPLTRLTIDLGPAGQVFDPAPQTFGFPFKVGGTQKFSAALVTAKLSQTNGQAKPNLLTVSFGGGGLPAGASVSFGIDRYVPGSTDAKNGLGSSGDQVAGAVVTARFRTAPGSKVEVTATLQNQTGTGFSILDGFGFVNASAALQALQMQRQTVSGR